MIGQAGLFDADARLRALSAAGTNNLFHFRREHVAAVEYREARMRAFEIWGEITGPVFPS